MRNTYAPALVLVAAILPIPVLATFITVIVYIVLGQQFGSPDWLNWTASLTGFGVTLIIWLICALFCRRFASAQYSNRLSYTSIIQELRRLELNFETIEVNDPEEAVELEEPVEAAVAAQAVKMVGTDEVATTTQAVEVLGSPESNGAIEPQVSSNSGALQRAYAALYGDNEKERIEERLQVNGMQWVLSTGSDFRPYLWFFAKPRH